MSALVTAHGVSDSFDAGETSSFGATCIEADQPERLEKSRLSWQIRQTSMSEIMRFGLDLVSFCPSDIGSRKGASLAENHDTSFTCDVAFHQVLA